MKNVKTSVAVSFFVCLIGLSACGKKDCHRPHPPKPPKHECHHPHDDTTSTARTEEVGT